MKFKSIYKNTSYFNNDVYESINKENSRIFSNERNTCRFFKEKI